MSVLTQSQVLAQNNDEAMNEAVVDFRVQVQQCVEKRDFHGRVIVEVDIVGSHVTLHRIKSEKTKKHR